MDDKRIAEIRARVEAATPGPWTIEYIGEDAPPFDHQYITGRILSEHHTYTGNSVDVPGCVNDPSTMTTRDANLIAHAPTDLADLLAALDAARADVARLREALTRSRAWLKGAAETFREFTDCEATPRCADWNPTQRLEEGCDSYCERAHDMRRGIVEIDAALAATETQP